MSSLQLRSPGISLPFLMLATADRVTLNDVSGKMQASLICCTQQVYEAILFGVRDLGEENMEGKQRKKEK